MYAVTIYSQTTGLCRTSFEPTLTMAVMLTLGISAAWTICEVKDATAECYYLDNNDAAYGMGPDYRQHGRAFVKDRWNEYKKYQHALRALVQRWTKRLAKLTILQRSDREHYAWLCRLSDLELVREHNQQLRLSTEEYEPMTYSITLSDRYRS